MIEFKVTAITVGPFGYTLAIDPNLPTGVMRLIHLDGTGFEFDERDGLVRALPLNAEEWAHVGDLCCPSSERGDAIRTPVSTREASQQMRAMARRWREDSQTADTACALMARICANELEELAALSGGSS